MCPQGDGAVALNALADYYEAAVAAFGGEPKLIANWVQNEILRLAREQNLSRVIGLARFLIRPELRCANLASRSYRLALARVRADWQARYGHPVWLVETFVEVDGTRYVIPGDLAMGEADGSLTLLGRGAQSINSGGEKIFPEEVEAAVKSHPAVYDAIAAWFRALPAGTSAAVADIPLLYETGRAGEFDEVVVTACPPEEQVRRLVSRDGLSELDARARLAAQWPIAEKVARAGAVIDTSGAHEQTDAQVDALVARWSA